MWSRACSGEDGDDLVVTTVDHAEIGDDAWPDRHGRADGAPSPTS
ncbi:hypothetical protein [uncultured Nocardioides sp.]|nr:hypothetical protein [uncultured Nocardioides sp.]